MTSVVSALITWSDWLLFVAPIVFIIYYSCVAKWWNNVVGRAIVFLMATISLVPSSKPISLVFGISSSSDTYKVLEVVTHYPAIPGVLLCLWSLVHVRRFRGQLGFNGVKHDEED